MRDGPPLLLFRLLLSSTSIGAGCAASTAPAAPAFPPSLQIVVAAGASSSTASELHAVPAFPSLIVVAAGASSSELHAASSLRATLHAIAPSRGFAIVTTAANAANGGSVPHIAVGHGAALALGAPPGLLAGLGTEGLLVATTGNGTWQLPPSCAVLTGGPAAPRGALYAVNVFLEALGVKFLGRYDTTMPAALPAVLPAKLFTLSLPRFEYRQLMEFQATNFVPGRNYSTLPGGLTPASGASGAATVDFMVHRRLNSAGPLGGSAAAQFPDPAHGGTVAYANPPGFVHTSYGLLSPKATNLKAPDPAMWKAHNEWFWPRTDPTEYGQLCWSNASLQQFIIKNLKSQLALQPAATIVSVSQNDNENFCQDPAELAVNKAEGTPGGALFRAVNVIAEALEEAFPHVLVDTLAYQWSLPAPKVMTPHKNVVIRICPLDTNLAQPITSIDNADVAFRKAFAGWAAISNRTYIWSYIANYQDTMSPFPDWLVLGPNLNFYAANGVRGMFAEGAYTGPGADMAELKDYLLSRLMWGFDGMVELDDRDIIRQFLDDYYGTAAAPFIRHYMDTVTGSLIDSGYFVRYSFDGVHAPYLTPMVLLTSADAFVHARVVVANSSVILTRVVRSSMAVYFVVLSRWQELRSFAKAEQIRWPLEPTLREAFAVFSAAFNATKQLYGVAPALSLGVDGDVSMAMLRASLFMDSAGCASGSSSPQLPYNITGSGGPQSYVYGPYSVKGFAMIGPPPAFVELVLAPPGAEPWLIGGIHATPSCRYIAQNLPCPDGNATHVLSLDGRVVKTWETGLFLNASSHLTLAWSPTSMTRARTVRIATTQNVSRWVDWAGIQIFRCAEDADASVDEVPAAGKTDDETGTSGVAVVSVRFGPPAAMPVVCPQSKCRFGGSTAADDFTAFVGRGSSAVVLGTANRSVVLSTDSGLSFALLPAAVAKEGLANSAVGPGTPFPCGDAAVCTVGDARLNVSLNPRAAVGDRRSVWNASRLVTPGGWRVERTVIKAGIEWALPPGLCLYSDYSAPPVYVRGSGWLKTVVTNTMCRTPKDLNKTGWGRVHPSSIQLFAEDPNSPGSWGWRSQVADGLKTGGQEGANENAIVVLDDPGALLCIFRVDGGDGWPDHRHKPFMRVTSRDAGLHWSNPVSLPAHVLSARPQLVKLPGGPLLLSGGRPMLGLWISVDGKGEGWSQTYNLAGYHNAGQPDKKLRFCEAFANGTADWLESTCCAWPCTLT